MNKQSLNVLDLFCGAGGLSLGFSLAGFRIIGGIDFDIDAVNTHDLNFTNSLSYCGDIKTFEDKMISDKFKNRVDIIIGGPPCQGFSSANMWQKDIKEDDRNKLFFEFIRFVRIINPKIFLIENVKQVMTKDGGFAKAQIYKIMEEEGYSISSQILRASDYGVPQNRERAFFIGIRSDIKEIFNFDEIIKKEKINVKEAISDLYNNESEYEKEIKEYKSKPYSDYQKEMRRDCQQLYNHIIKYPNDKVIERIKYVGQGENWKSVPIELWDTQRNNRHSSAYRRLDARKVSITIDTGHMNYFHPKYNRVPTVRESARIQSFPDDFIFLGSKTSQFKQVGNAVPPLLAKAIANKIKEILER